ncbi:uncharacterized protein B0I36DRAFT_105054 [Microdochium trichocladiopsis]|uniref:Uncharacterized protein n=1 Tax=Microdochium trichocladiopsis TaxID=1682393 RepID=A0A9P8Y8K6_9PEZI|nr:uncharacterized protein B0I36DRAFT_105054 [Microdochium trichocladiopsis]KAH7033107.1 hypothetical protein B0I36DRAFT_105054 [Microdochium trichocladiopsis]
MTQDEREKETKKQDKTPQRRHKTQRHDQRPHVAGGNHMQSPKHFRGAFVAQALDTFACNMSHPHTLACSRLPYCRSPTQPHEHLSVCARQHMHSAFLCFFLFCVCTFPPLISSGNLTCFGSCCTYCTSARGVGACQLHASMDVYMGTVHRRPWVNAYSALQNYLAMCRLTGCCTLHSVPFPFGTTNPHTSVSDAVPVSGWRDDDDDEVIYLGSESGSRARRLWKGCRVGPPNPPAPAPGNSFFFRFLFPCPSST